MKRLRWVALALAIWASSAQAAYIGSPLLITPQNNYSEVVGVGSPAQQTIPLITQPLPPFPPSVQPVYTIPPLPPVPPFVTTPAVIETDGFKAISITPPFRGAVPNQNALAVSISPNPAFQCPLIAPVNQTASTTTITNPGGKYIHVCSAVLINGATAQSITLSEGTGTTCGTGTSFWLGGSSGTAALAANGGFAISGNWVNLPMQVRGDNVCVTQSGSTNLSGYLTYGIFP